MKSLVHPLLAAGVLLFSCATSAPPPDIQAAAAENVTVPTREAGMELQLPAILHKPVGGGPFAAVVMLCGQGGWAGGGPNAEHQTFWARKLVGWGYVALQVESFSPRGPRSVETVTADVACHDAYAAKTYLSALPFVDPENIAVMGWSHGGIAVLSIIDRSLILNREQVISDGQGLSVRKVSPFKAAVAFYPYSHPLSDPDTPLLVLTGRKDDACPVFMTSSLKNDYARTKCEFSLKIYPNAYHAFDLEALKGGIVINGHHFEYDERATSDAITRTKAFLGKYIGARRGASTRNADGSPN
jgi:dienelactone hydrolase